MINRKNNPVHSSLYFHSHSYKSYAGERGFYEIHELMRDESKECKGMGQASGLYCSGSYLSADILCSELLDAEGRRKSIYL